MTENWLDRLLGNPGEWRISSVKGNATFNDAGMVHLKELPDLEFLDLSGTQVTDVGLEHIMRLRYLRRLDLRDTSITATRINQLQEALPLCKIEY